MGNRFRCLLLLFLLLPGCSGDGLVGIRVGNSTARVELSITPEARREGLMGRTSLGADEGLLMVFPQEQTIEIWMLNMRIPLDVAFFDRDGVLLEWSSMEPDGGRRIYASPRPARYVLEMNRGWFGRHRLQPGARLQIADAGGDPVAPR